MTALNFPDSPTNGEVYEGYVYDSSDNVWNRLPEAPGINLENLGNVTGTPTAGDSLIYDGSNWLNTPQKNRNLFYNGAMQVHQRGTSYAGLAIASPGIIGDCFTADRWLSVIRGSGTWTQTVENDGPSGSGFSKSLKMLCTTADASLGADNIAYIEQRVEAQNLQVLKKGSANAESFTVSFWVKSNVTGTYIVRIVDQANSRSVSASYSIVSSGVWEKKTITFAGDTSGVLLNDNNIGLRPQFYIAAGSNSTSGTLATSWGASVTANTGVGQVNLAAATSNYWQLTGVQFEVGTVATPFEFKPFGQEIIECQRYFQIIGDSSTAFKSFTFLSAENSTEYKGLILLPTVMRAAPSIGISGAFALAGIGAVTVSGFPDPDSFSAINIIAAGSGFVVGQTRRLLANNNAATRIEVRSEL